MQLQNLRSIRTLEALKSELKKTPPELLKIYQELYAQINRYKDFEREITIFALQLVMHSFRTLKARELIASLPIGHGWNASSEEASETILDLSDTDYFSTASDPSEISTTPEHAKHSLYYSQLDQVLDLCAHFLVVDPGTQIVRLAHIT